MKLFQGLVNQMRHIVDDDFGIMDMSGLILADTNEGLIGTIHSSAPLVTEKKDVFFKFGETLFHKVQIKSKPEYFVYIKNKDESSKTILSMFALNVVNIRNYFEDRFDKANLFRKIIVGSIPKDEILPKARQLHVPLNARRAVLLITTGNNTDAHFNEILQSLFPGRGKDFVVVLDENSIVLIKDLRAEDDYKELDRIAKAVVDTLNTELMAKAYVGIGSITENLMEIARSYEEARIALRVGGIFEGQKTILNYNNLGMGRLIYQLPKELCEKYLEEVFKEGSLESLDRETFYTIQKFFENNLNVSETSRQLYVHRNTLVYRLDRIQKITGLDLRKFSDAIIFKLSILVKEYLDRNK